MLERIKALLHLFYYQDVMIDSSNKLLCVSDQATYEGEGRFFIKNKKSFTLYQMGDRVVYNDPSVEGEDEIETFFTKLLKEMEEFENN